MRQPTESEPMALSYAHIPPPPPPPAGAPIYATAPSSAGAPARPRRRGRVVAGSLAAVLALGAGGLALAGGGSDAPSTPVVAAAERTVAASTARVEVRISGSQLAGEVTMTGVVDFDAPATQLELDLGALAGDAELFGGRLDAGATRVEMISSGTAVYLKLGALAELVDGGPGWLKLDTAQLPEGSGPLGERMPTTGLTDPAALLALLREHADEVTEVGPDTLDGARVTHYTARFDLARLVAESPDAMSPEQLDALLAELDDATVTTDLWVGDDGYVHQLVVRMAGPDGDLTATLRLRDFGVPAAVAVPAEDEAIDLTRLLGR